MEFYFIAQSSSKNLWDRRASSSSNSDVEHPGQDHAAPVRETAAAAGSTPGIGWGPFRDPTFVPTDPRVQVPCSYTTRLPMNIQPSPPRWPSLCLIDVPSTLELHAPPQSASYDNITHVFEVTASTRMFPVSGVSLTAALSNTNQRRAVCEPGSHHCLQAGTQHAVPCCPILPPP